MIKRIAFILLLLSQHLAESQNWGSVNGVLKKDFDLGNVEFVLTDSVHNELIVSSKFFKSVNGKYVRGICRWNGTRWDSLAGGINTHDVININPGGMAMSSISYQGKLLVGGMFQSVGGVNATSLALWDGTKWDSLPKRAFRFTDEPVQVAGFYKHNNLLYIYGTFDTIAGQPCSGIATWDGNNFNPIVLPVSYVGGIKNVVYYKNQLYVAGGFYDPGIFYNHKRHILRYNGTKWDSVGVGILGSFNTGLGSMLIYKNELYVGGHFLKADGNVGENVMKWDGNQWHDVGFEGEYIGGVRQLIIKDEKLYAVGAFNIAANHLANHFAIYDGERWCTTKDTLDAPILSTAIYKDTLYIAGGFWSVSGDSTIHGIAKLLNDAPYRWCNPPLPTTPVTPLSVYPVPFNNYLTIDIPNNYSSNTTSIQITNSLGQVVTSQIALSYNVTINTSNLSSGMYYLTLQDGSHKKTVKIIKE